MKLSYNINFMFMRLEAIRKAGTRASLCSEMTFNLIHLRVWIHLLTRTASCSGWHGLSVYN